MGNFIWTGFESGIALSYVRGTKIDILQLAHTHGLGVLPRRLERRKILNRWPALRLLAHTFGGGEGARFRRLDGRDVERLGRLLFLLFDLDGMLAGARVLRLDGRAWRHLQGGQRLLHRGHGFLDLLKDGAKALFDDYSNRLLLEIFLLFLAAEGE